MTDRHPPSPENTSDSTESTSTPETSLGEFPARLEARDLQLLRLANKELEQFGDGDLAQLISAAPKVLLDKYGKLDATTDNVNPVLNLIRLTSRFTSAVDDVVRPRKSLTTHQKLMISEGLRNLEQLNCVLLAKVVSAMEMDRQSVESPDLSPALETAILLERNAYGVALEQRNTELRR